MVLLGSVKDPGPVKVPTPHVDLSIQGHPQ